MLYFISSLEHHYEIGVLACFTKGDGEAVQKAKLSNLCKNHSASLLSGLPATLTFFQIKTES